MNQYIEQHPSYRRVRYEEIPEFPNYAVGEDGAIVNMTTGGSPLHISANRQGLPKVTLVNQGKPSTRSPAKLVAQAFVPREREDFDTVIHLNNDRMDCRASNLAWRPRWFAIAFHKQFLRDYFHTNNGKILCRDTGVVYDSPKAACMELGILYGDILLSFTNDSYTFPTMQQWSWVE